MVGHIEAPVVSEQASAVPFTAASISAAKDKENASWTALERDQELELMHVLLFHRHGDRSPVFEHIGKWQVDKEAQAFWMTRHASEDTLQELGQRVQVVGVDPTKPRPVETPGFGAHMGLGRLTQLGVDHLVNKGAMLRQRYADFIDKHHVQHDPFHQVYVQSSYLPRTIQSVEGLLHGMFPIEETKALETADDASSRVFYVRTTATNRLMPKHEMQVFTDTEIVLQDELDQLDADRKARINALRDQLREIVGIPAPTSMPWLSLRDFLTCNKAHGLPFPSDITDDLYAEICRVDGYLLHALYHRKDVCLSAFDEGTIEVYDQLRYVVESDLHPGLDDPQRRGLPKLSFFSAHDNSIIALFAALDLQMPEPIVPAYGAVAAFELFKHRTSNQYYIRVVFEDRVVPFAGQKDAAVIPFAEFETHVQHFLGDA